MQAQEGRCVLFDRPADLPGSQGTHRRDRRWAAMMNMSQPDQQMPLGFNKVWAELPFKMKLMLVHLWRAELERAGAYPPVEPVAFQPVAHRRVS